MKILWLPTLWWFVNLSDNWAFNVWTVNFINSHNSSQLQYAIFCSGQCVYCDWLKYSLPPTHQVIQPVTDFSHLLIVSVCVPQQDRICLPIKICMYTTRKSCPIVGELVSSPMEDNGYYKSLQFCPQVMN